MNPNKESKWSLICCTFPPPDKRPIFDIEVDLEKLQDQVDQELAEPHYSVVVPNSPCSWSVFSGEPEKAYQTPGEAMEDGWEPISVEMVQGSPVNFIFKKRMDIP